MNGSAIQTWMSDILHAVTQGLLVPDILLLVLFMGYALFCIGSIISEYFTERKHFKAEMPRFLAALMAAEEKEIPEVIEQSGLLKRQKVALLTVYDYRMLPGDALVALIKRLVSEEESRYDRISGRNNMAARVSPMLGLMGTLIPLGPGIQALGSANTEMLSASLLIAFDTTVAGLVTAAVCMVIGKIRSIWYGNYMSALDSAMATMLQKIEDMRAEGKIVIKEPSDYAFLFEQTASNKAEKKGDGKPADKPADKPASKPAERKTADLGGKDRSADAKAAFVAEPTPIPTPTRQAAPQPATAATASAATSIAPAEGATPDFLSKISAETPVDPTVNPAPFAQNPSPAPANPLDALAYEPAKTNRFSASFAPVPDPAFISDLAAASAANPAPAPAANPVPIPTADPAQVPAMDPVPVPAMDPVPVPTMDPVPVPTADPAPAPAANPMPIPTLDPAPIPTMDPVPNPTMDPASAPVANPVPTATPEFTFPFDPSQSRQSTGWYQPRLRTDDQPVQPYTQNGGYPADTPYQNR